MPDTLKNSKRIKALRRALIAEVPRFPNDKASRGALEAKDLTDLLIVYIGWRLRHVAARPRRVTGQSSLAGNPRAAALKLNIDAFLSEVQAGTDLTPYLSLLAQTKGYTPAAEGQQAVKNSWADKDFMLNVMGLHHFHLGLMKETAGHMKRTDDLLFASVTRDTFEVIGLFDHGAFEHEDDGSMTAERKRLWSVYEARQAANALPGQIDIGGYANRGITTSGQPTAVVFAAQQHVRIMRDMDAKLDDPQFVHSLYQSTPAPVKPELRWYYKHLDLGLVDGKTSFFGNCSKGPN